MSRRNLIGNTVRNVVFNFMNARRVKIKILSGCKCFFLSWYFIISYHSILLRIIQFNALRVEEERIHEISMYNNSHYHNIGTSTLTRLIKGTAKFMIFKC